MAKHTYKKLLDAPPHHEPDVEPGDTFDADYTPDQETALLAAGWIEPADKKKGDK